MGYLSDNCVRYPVSKRLLDFCQPFSCGDGKGEQDLNEFFNCDCIRYEEQLMGKTYCFVVKSEKEELTNKIAAMFTVSNGSIFTKLLDDDIIEEVGSQIDEEKRHITYPAVLIGRLGVSDTLQGRGLHVGRDMMNMIKAWFIDPNNKTGCRFIIVDAYNKENTKRYYLHNGFKFIFESVDDEKRYRNLTNIKGRLKTRMMYFDLMEFKKKD